MKASISFLLFNAGDCPGGGIKVILEYANRFAIDGYDVRIIYPASINWRSSSLLYKIKCVYIYLKRLFFIGFSSKSWFALNKDVKEYWVFSLNYSHIPKSDYYIATEVRTSSYLNAYPVDLSRKFYFIQGYENWNVSDAFLRNTYHYELNKIVISKWLYEIITKEEGVNCVLIPNGFDFTYFKNSIPIENRNKYILSLLYNQQELKDCKTAIKAIEIVKESYPELRVLSFGTYPRSSSLPDWYEYYQRPDKVTHNYINNTASIYVASSIFEGFGLTVGEAMLSGQAVVCTNNKGYLEMAKDEDNALVSPVKDYKSLAHNIIRLIQDDELRYRLANKAHLDIKSFSWEESYRSIKRTILGQE